MAKSVIKSLYYITHRDNIPSMLEQGILSHRLVEERQVDFTPIYDDRIVSNRHSRSTPDNHSLWDYANFYFQARNPMLYRVVKEKSLRNIVILGIKPDILGQTGAFISIGNAASPQSDIVPAISGIRQIERMWNILNDEWWKEADGSKRKMMAECLVPSSIRPEMIHSIYVPNQTIAQEVQSTIAQHSSFVRPEVVVDPKMFFLPTRRIEVANRLSLVEGDMFFSQLHTLTVSVNTVGVMGKGLASRARYQFPDVYVKYQDWCKQKKLKMGSPMIYKREGSLDSELAADSFYLPNPNDTKWFLLFPTKRHWKEKSDLKGIEEGLDWLVGNAEQEGIQSLALPALGCGLGQLAWGEVGPLMVRYLQQLSVPVAIYLPHEQALPEEELTEEFLLGG